MHLFAQAFAPRKLGENTTQGGMWWSDLSYPLFGENTMMGNQTELGTRTVNWILVPQRWCFGGWDRLEDIYCCETQLFSQTLDLPWVGMGISLQGTKCFQTIFMRHGIRWNLEGERRSFFSLCSQEWGTWRMRCGGHWRFQLAVMETLLSALATPSPLCDTFCGWKLLKSEHDTLKLVTHIGRSTSVCPKPSVKCC